MTGANNGKITSDSHTAIPVPIFSTTQAFTLPPECWYLVNDASITKAEIKVTLCVLLNTFGAGIDATQLSFTDIEKQTGMSKSSVLSGLDAAMARGSIFKLTSAGKIVYEPGSKKIEPMTCLSCHDSTISLNSKHEETTCHVSEIEPRQKILQQLLEFGLATHVANNIALSNRYGFEQLQRQMDYVEFEYAQGLMPTRQMAIPGYIVNRIKFDRIAPHGYGQTDSTWTLEEQALFVR